MSLPTANITLSIPTIVGHLRAVRDRLSNENSHGDALIVSIAIQALDAGAVTEERDDITVKRIVDVVRAGLKEGHFDAAAQDMIRRLTARGNLG